MIEFITASENIPFAVALAVMFGIALLEGIASLFGAGFSSFLDSLFPEFDANVDLDESEVTAPNTLSRLLSWLRVGRVPILMLLVVFLTAYGLMGLGVQWLAEETYGALLSGWLASIPAMLIAVPTVSICGGLLDRFMPSDETEAVSEKTFIGRIATITLGTAKVGSAAEAKVKDRYGHHHYLMIEPDSTEDDFQTGENILIVKKEGAVFKGIRNTSNVLI